MQDIFTAAGTLISPAVRNMQLEFHNLRNKRAVIVKALAPARKEYKQLRARGYSGRAQELDKFRDRILAANEQLAEIDATMGGLTRGVEALNVISQGGANFRPGVATMGLPE